MSIAFILLVAACGSVLPDTAAPESRGRSSLVVESSIPGVRVFLDTMFVGLAPLTDSLVDTGTHTLRFVHPEGNSWLHPAVIETLNVPPSSALRREVHFPPCYHVDSEPSGARVRYADSLLGETPLYVVLHGEGLLRLSLDGYSDVSLPLDPGRSDMYVPLSLLPGTSPIRSPFLSYEQSKSSTPIVLAAGATVLSGALAAYCKIKADGYYSDYQQTGNVRLLDDVRRFDAEAAVSLATSQISLLVLSYLLFSR